MLDSLRELTGGNAERMQLYANMFLEEISSYLPKMKEAFTDGRMNDLKNIVHTCKSLLQTMGFDVAYKQAQKLELMIIDKAYADELNDGYYLFIKQLNDCMQEVKDNLNELG
ncbi:MAG: Hpt domain-containing protein [Bacteroidetes bacterium]|nr:Hpt domain-containing protein [Bacteroidota bacterium]